MSDALKDREQLVFRPARRRTGRFVAVVVGCVCALVFLAFVFGGGSASDADSGDAVWASLLFGVGLWGLPAVLWAVYLALSNRNR